MKGNMNSMLREENEVTFYLKGNEYVDMREFLYDLLERIYKIDICLEYHETIEIRFKGEEDKIKLVFRINHGDIFFRYNIKNRLININENIKKCNEKISVWKPIEKLDLSIFNNELLAVYYKETYKFKYNRLRHVGHVLHYLDTTGHKVLDERYFELEGENLEEKIDIFEPYLINAGCTYVSRDNTKTMIGKKLLEKNYIEVKSTESLYNMLIQIFKNRACAFFEN